jgi:hypothetical protein
MGLLTKDMILNAQDKATETVKVAEWGGEVLVASMSGADRDAFEQSLFETVGKDRRQNLNNARAKLVARCLVDEAGNRLFEESDIAALGRKSAKALDRVFEAAQRLNGLREGEVEEMTGN